MAALEAGRPALALALRPLRFRKGDERAFEQALREVFPPLESVSVDYAVLEGAPNVVVIEAAFDWDDLGSWSAWARRQPRDARGNVTWGDAVAVECDRCIVVGDGITAAPLRLQDMVVVATLEWRARVPDRGQRAGAQGRRGRARAGEPMTARRGRAFALLLAAAALSGCAAGGAIEPPAGPVPSPASAAAEPARAAGGEAARDTTPSPEALAVLATIPEPVPGARDAVAAGRATPRPVAVGATLPAPAPDSLARTMETRLVATSDSSSAPADSGLVPVPAPTTPLGVGTAERVPPPALPEPPPAAATPAASATPATAGPDTCWRVQIGAPAERPRGRVLRDASQSLLLVPMSMDHEGGRWKVRTRDCLQRAAAQGLRDRAIVSGFKGVFLVRVVERR